MATIFFARKGTDPNRASVGQHVSIETVVDKLASYSSQYRSSPPIINPDDKPSPYSAYTLTVVEVESSETSSTFPKAGFYWFSEVPPDLCCTLLGLREPAR